VLWECHHHLLPDLLNLHLQVQHEKKLQLLQSCTQEWMKRWLFPWLKLQKLEEVYSKDLLSSDIMFKVNLSLLEAKPQSCHKKR
jgi:hypothetical protein